MKKLSAIAVSVILSMSSITARAEYRIWTDNDGTTIEAELVRILGDEVVLKKTDQGIVKIKLTSLSKADKKYASLNSPPKIEIDVSLDSDRTNESRGRSRDGGVQVQKESIECEVTLEKEGSNSYEAPLRAHLLIIGKLEKKDYFVVMSLTHEKFTFREEMEYSLSAKLNLKQFETSHSGSSGGVEYEGYLVAVTDPEGKILSLKGSRSLFEKNVEILMTAKHGAVYDDDFNLIDDGTKMKEMKAQEKSKRPPRRL